MKIFLKAQLSSLIATLVDFSVLILLVELFRMNYPIAISIAAVCGALTNFIVNRVWAFKQYKNSFVSQGFKYGLVWTASLALNISGVLLLTDIFRLQYVLSKIIIATLVGITINYSLQKRFVFNPNDKKELF